MTPKDKEIDFRTAIAFPITGMIALGIVVLSGADAWWFFLSVWLILLTIVRYAVAY